MSNSFYDCLERDNTKLRIDLLEEHSKNHPFIENDCPYIGQSFSYLYNLRMH